MRLLWWLFSRLTRNTDAEDLALVIKPPIQKWAVADESVRERTMKRRAAADKIRQRAALVETGESVSAVLKIVNQ